MIAIPPVARGDVARVMRVHRTRTLEQIAVRRPTRLLPAHPPPPPRQERVIERLEGFLEHLGARAEVLIFEHGRPAPYSMPAERFLQLGIREGDSFQVEVIEVDGRVTGRIAGAPVLQVQPPPGGYLTAEELARRADPWD